MSTYTKLAVLLIVVCLPIMAFASTDSQLQTAAENGNVAFVLITEPGAVGVDLARQMIKSAIDQIPGALMIESNRADAANSPFIKKYKLAVAPVPLILVFASNGVMAGGNVASKLTSQQLVAMVPSPKKAEVLKAIQLGQAVYVTASRPGMESKVDIFKECAEACTQMRGKSVAIDVNMDDPVEVGLLNQLKIDRKSKKPVTVVINTKGQITATYNGMVETEALVASAIKVVKSSCCSSGSGKSCGPKPKKKRN